MVTTRDDLLAALGETRPGFVPTMGSLHAGHLSLISRASRENRVTVVSVFVNPTQFDNPEDLARYPRDLEADSALAIATGADLIFAPAADAIYPPGFDTMVEVGGLSARWEGESRPGHLRGVATVVTILMNLVRPARAYFGEKDYQQLQVIRRLHRDLALSGEIVGCPTVRDEDGLALSSRNARLSWADRRRAAAIPLAMSAVQDAIADGEWQVGRLEAIGRQVLEQSGIAVDYLAVVDESSLEPLRELKKGARLLLAVEIGGTRLIDNIALELPTNVSQFVENRDPG